MKKVFAILTALLFFSFMSYAQNNDGYINQTGNNQDAQITHYGSNNEADIIQFTDNDGPQDADVYQYGNWNDAFITQNQTGGGGTTLNEAYIKQSGDNNYALQYENAPGYNSGQQQKAEQYGNYNNSQQRIYEGYTQSQINLQVGDRNITHQTFEDGAYQFATVETYGNWNQAYQRADVTKATIKIYQYGDQNYGKQDFVGTFGFSPTNTGEIVQSGDWNDAYQFKTGGQKDNHFMAKQYGDYNYSYQTLTGNENDADVYQYGDRNYAYENQSGEGNDVDVTQSGDWNDAIVYQSNTVDGNTADITQYGDYNYGYINQLGDMNNASIFSSGSYHSGIIYQTGNESQALITQGN